MLAYVKVTLAGLLMYFVTICLKITPFSANHPLNVSYPLCSFISISYSKLQLTGRFQSHVNIASSSCSFYPLSLRSSFFAFLR